MNLDPATCRRLFLSVRSVRLATTGPDGPHLVPVVFAVEPAAGGSDPADATGVVLVSMVDHKPKRSRTLKRLTNLTADPRAALLADVYDDNWDRLWWVRADCRTEISTDPDDVRFGARLLAARYPQYIDHPPEGPLMRFRVQHWSGWSAQPPAPEMTLEQIAALAAAAEEDLRTAGHSTAADQIRSALDVPPSDREYLLILREALVATRPAWSTLPDPTPRTLSHALSAAKRLAATSG